MQEINFTYVATMRKLLILLLLVIQLEYSTKPLTALKLNKSIPCSWAISCVIMWLTYVFLRRERVNT